MANIINLPLLSDTMEEGIIADIFFKVGDKISGGDILGEVETDKATMEVEAYDEHEGTLLYIVNAGDAVPVGGILAITGEEGEDISSILEEAKNNTSTSKDDSTEEEEPTKKEESKEETPQPKKEQTQPETKVENNSKETSSSSDGRLKVSPLAKRMAEDAGLSLESITGSGDEGRIVKRDIEDAIKNGVQKPQSNAPSKTAEAATNNFVSYASTGEEHTDEVKVTTIRKTIAKRLAESKFTNPHFYLTMEINMDKMMTARKEMNSISPAKISFNDLVMKASAMALRQHPDVNSSWQGDKILVHRHIHVGMAVAIPTGLVVPVIKFADQLPLSQLAAQTKEMATKARDGKLSLEEMQGQTFSVSNLGSMGIDEFTAIINPPNAAILAVGGISKRMREVNGEMKAVNIMKVTLSCDHRVVDGLVGSEYLKTLKNYMENPTLMLV